MLLGVRDERMKTGVIDVGGGFRGIYTSGVLDYCMDHQIRFDLGIGISAGSANLITYAAGQPRRCQRFFAEYGLRKEYAGIGNFIRKKSFIDMDYVYGTLSNSDGEYPLDYAAFSRNAMDFYAVATEAETGNAVFFGKEAITQDDYSVLKASCAIPGVCRPYSVHGVPYFDGALGDPVPVQKAFDMGCDRIVLLLTKPENVLRSSGHDLKLAQMIQKKYPLAADKLRQRAQRYNDGVALAQKYATEGKALIVAPEDTCGVSTLTRDPNKLHQLYDRGYADGKKILAYMNLDEKKACP